MRRRAVGSLSMGAIGSGGKPGRHPPVRRFVLATAACVTVLFGVPGAAFAHDERQATAPMHDGHVPQLRTAGTTLLVCKTDKADFDRRILAFPAELRTTNLTLWTQCQSGGY